MNDHSWATSYDPPESGTAYKIHSRIFQVIGGNQDGNADIRAPVNVFSQQDLGTLLGVLQPNNSSTIAPKRSNGRSNLGKRAIVGIILAAVAGIGIVILVVYFMIWRRRRCQPDPLESSSSTTALRRAAENSRSNFTPELCNGAIAAHEMDSPDNEACESDTTEKHIFELGTGHTDWPPSPQPRKVPVFRSEMEGELGWHPAVRPVGRD